MSEGAQWRRCSACKEPIRQGALYWTCNVSTCNRKRTGLVFCSVRCWEVHLPSANHRQAWAVEQTAPRGEAVPRGSSSGRRRIVRTTPASTASAGPPSEVLIVSSRLKDYVRARCGFNTSEGVLGPLSDIVRRICDEAIQSARAEGRRTVLDRDIPSS